MDGAYLGSGDIALHKAQTSARFPFPTRGVQELAYGKDLKGGMVPGLALVPGIIAFAGGLPIMTEGKVHIGGIGVSGGTSDQDETCAQLDSMPSRTLSNRCHAFAKNACIEWRAKPIPALGFPYKKAPCLGRRRNMVCCHYCYSPDCRLIASPHCDAMGHNQTP